MGGSRPSDTCCWGSRGEESGTAPGARLVQRLRRDATDGQPRQEEGGREPVVCLGPVTTSAMPSDIRAESLSWLSHTQVCSSEEQSQAEDGDLGVTVYIFIYTHAPGREKTAAKRALPGSPHVILTSNGEQRRSKPKRIKPVIGERRIKEQKTHLGPRKDPASKKAAEYPACCWEAEPEEARGGPAGSGDKVAAHLDQRRYREAAGTTGTLRGGWHRG